MLTRTYANVTQAYFPFYILNVQKMPQMYISTLPMIMYLASFVVSNVTSLRCVNGRFNGKACLPNPACTRAQVCFTVGAGVGLCTCILIYGVDTLSPVGMYVLSAVLGVTNSLCSVASASFIADLIHDNTVRTHAPIPTYVASTHFVQSTGAFVYGVMSLMDKLAGGVAYQCIELFNPQQSSSSTASSSVTDEASVHAHFYQLVLVYVTGACLIGAVLVLVCAWTYVRKRAGVVPARLSLAHNCSVQVRRCRTLMIMMNVCHCYTNILHA
jgi:hypothetical protein